MPPLKEVPQLLDLSVECLHNVIREEAMRVSKVIETHFFYEEVPGTEEYDLDDEENMAADREVYLSDQITAFKDHVFEHVPLNLVEKVIKPIVLGIRQALTKKKKLWSPTTNMSKFIKSIYAITEFAELVVVPCRRALDLSELPKVGF